MKEGEEARAEGVMFFDDYPFVERGSFRMGSRGLCGKIGVRCDVTGREGLKLKGGLEKVLGCRWEERPCTYSEGGDRVCIWLGPDEWLVLCGEEEVSELMLRFRAVGEGEGRLVACVEKTDQYEHIVLEGESVRRCLEGCVLMDFSEESFGEDRVVGTLLGCVHVLIMHRGEERFELFVRRSEASYVWRMLEMTSRFYS